MHLSSPLMTALPLLALLSACDSTIPIDPNAGPAPSSLSGAVVASFDNEPATTIILVASADDPLPPFGTGRPITLSTVPATAFSNSGGVQSAAYAINNLPEGDWLLSGLIDVDGDFHPNIDAFAGATCGDIVGGHVTSFSNTSLAAVSTTSGEDTSGVTVTLASVLPIERPAFVLLDSSGDGGIPGVAIAVANTGAPQGFALQSTAIHAAIRRPDETPSITYDLDGPYTVQTDNPPVGNPLGLDPSPLYDLFAPTCDVAFFVHFLDEDADGQPDPHPLIPGVFNAWPQIGLTWIGAPTDTDGDGVVDTFLRDSHPDETWVAPAVVSPALLQAGIPVGIPVLMTQLPVAWIPIGQRTRATEEADCTGIWTAGLCEETITVPDELPLGAWAITVIESTGQTWTVPNTLAGASSTDAVGFSAPLQGTFLVVQ